MTGTSILVVATSGTASVMSATSAGAEPNSAHPAFVRTQSPPMVCQVSSADPDRGEAPNVACQSGVVDGFPGSMRLHQAVVTSSGDFAYRDANLPTGGDDFPPEVLASGSIHRLHGWTIAPTDDGVTFTNDLTGHGMTVHADQFIHPF